MGRVELHAGDTRGTACALALRGGQKAGLVPGRVGAQGVGRQHLGDIAVGRFRGLVDAMEVLQMLRPITLTRITFDFIQITGLKHAQKFIQI